MYILLPCQYKCETYDGNMSVNNDFGTCHFFVLECLEYIIGEMTWNRS